MGQFSSFFPGIASPPVLPQQTNTTCNCVNITWDTPLYDGAAPINTILVTFRSTSNISQVESVGTNSGNDTRLEICGLVPNEVYNATIVALNAAGSSEGVEFIIVITTPGK